MKFASIMGLGTSKKYYNVGVSLKKNGYPCSVQWTSEHVENVSEALDKVLKDFKLFKGEHIEKVTIVP